MKAAGLLLMLLWANTIATAEVITQANLGNQNSKFFHYVNAYVLSTILYQNAVNFDQRTGFVCNESYDIVPGNITILQPISFIEGKVHPVMGLWRHSYTLTRCGKNTTYNTYLSAKLDATPDAFNSVVGTSEVPLFAIYDVTKFTYEYVLGKSFTSCSSQAHVKNTVPVVYNTTLLSRSDNNNWQESWTIAYCDHFFSLVITFQQDAEKLVYSIIKQTDGKG